MTEHFDVIIVGAGHNGLVAAAYLARAGVKTLVLERRSTIGGAAATEEIFPGFHANTGAPDAGLFLPEIGDELDLAAQGLAFVEPATIALGLNPDGEHPKISRDVETSVSQISLLSSADAESFRVYRDRIQAYTSGIKDIFRKTAPEIPERSAAELMPWLQMGLKLRRRGGRELMDLVRVIPLPIRDYLDEHFESESLKGLLSVPAVSGGSIGPFQVGTTLMHLYQNLGVDGGGYRSFRPVKGGIGQLSAALAKAAEKNGAQIRTGTAVGKISLDEFNERVLGVVLKSGEEIAADQVVSNVDPRATFFQLVGGAALSPHFIREVSNIRYSGTTAKIILALADLPDFEGIQDPKDLSGNIVLSPSMTYVEHAADDAKYGRLPANPVLEMQIPTISDPDLAPTGNHIMSITVRFVPYALTNGTWSGQREFLGNRAIAAITSFAPEISKLIRHRQILTPQDLEQEYGLTEGSIYHGQMGLDQLFLLRPLPGYARYRTPFRGLYLCGAGTHPGGGVTGIPGKNAAGEILKDRR